MMRRPPNTPTTNTRVPYTPPFRSDIGAEAARLPRRPRVYFEEWDEPPITGIRWVAELVRIAGGDDVFPERALEPLAKARILEDPAEVVRRAPDIILGSWCGKKFRPEKVAARDRKSTRLNSSH